MVQPPFTLEPGPDGAPVLTVPSEDGDPVRVRLDGEAARALRDGIDAAVARGAQGGQGSVAEFRAGDANVVVLAVPGGSVRLRVER